LEGRWLLIGGAAVAAWLIPDRTTEDIDLVGMAGTQDERFALMNLALDAALPVEAVNSAADFFVRRIADWQDHLVVLHQGPRATIYRPDSTLFLLLKLGRLSEVDLADCEACLVAAEPFDAGRVLSALDALPESADRGLADRRAALRALVAR
jgi:hypothetical protein